MKTKTTGVSELTVSSTPYAPTHNLGPDYQDKKSAWACIEAVMAYKDARQNGTKMDVPAWPFEKDGRYTWAGNDRYAKEKQVEYIEGIRDQAWMEQRDRNYVFRLEREGCLDERERNLKAEAPKLYREIQLYRKARTESTPPGRIKKLLEPIETNTITIFDFSVITEEQHLAYFAEVRKQIGRMVMYRFIIPDFVPLSTEEITQIFRTLMQNQSVKTVNFGDIDLSVHIDAIVALIDKRPDIIIQPLAQIISEIHAILQQIASQFTERQEDDKVEIQPDLTVQARLGMGPL
jgi:hypothetical protein